MKRMMFFLLGAAMLWACTEEAPTAPKAATPAAAKVVSTKPPIRNAFLSPNCDDGSHPNSGGVIGVDLSPPSATIDKSVTWANDPITHLASTHLSASVWRDWATAPGVQFYCVDTASVLYDAAHLSWNNPQPAVLTLFGGATAFKALQIKATGTAKPYIVWLAQPTIRDTSVITVVP